MPHEEKGRGETTAGSWKVEVRLLCCNSRRWPLHHGLYEWSPQELCNAEPGQLDAATLETGNGAELWSQDEANSRALGNLELNRMVGEVLALSLLGSTP